MKTRGIFSAVIICLLFCLQFCASGEEQYYAVFIDGQRAGYAVHNRGVNGNEVRTSDRVMMTINRMGVPITIATNETCIETAKGEPIGFEAMQDMSMWRTTMTGRVAADGNVSIVSTTGQYEQTKNFQWPAGAVMAEGMLLIQKEKGLAEGTEYSLKMFSPSLMQAAETKIRVGPKRDVDLLGKMVTLTEVESVVNMFTGAVKSVSYVDDEFNTLKTQTAMMGIKLEMVACDKGFAIQETEPTELLGKTFIKSPKPMKNIKAAKSARYKIRPTGSATDFKIPSDDNQKVKVMQDGSVLVIVSPAFMPGRTQLGYRGRDKEVLDALKSNRYVQSDDEKIKELAKQAIGDTRNAAEAVRKIEAFVGNYIEQKDLSVGYASAAEVAQSKQGDCTEFAVLTAAMCRAAGIPARVVVGVAYVDEFMGNKDVFGGHAWTEVFIGNRWVGLDSAFRGSGRGGYDAGHIALASGSGELEDYFGLLFNLGQFEIEDVKVLR
ncbi:MAG: transglutaminase-like domain-containing protein [Phycisphaerae bacterium]